jgi:hypothetical protein
MVLFSDRLPLLKPALPDITFSKTAFAIDISGKTTPFKRSLPVTFKSFWQFHFYAWKIRFKASI